MEFILLIILQLDPPNSNSNSELHFVVLKLCSNNSLHHCVVHAPVPLSLGNFSLKSKRLQKVSTDFCVIQC